MLTSARPELAQVNALRRRDVACPNANGAGIAASPTLACIRVRPIWANRLLPGVVQDNLTAMMRFERLECLRTASARHRDARRIGPDRYWPKPGPIVSSLTIRWPVKAGVHRPNILLASGPREDRPVPSGGGSSPKAFSVPPGGSVA